MCHNIAPLQISLLFIISKLQFINAPHTNFLEKLPSILIIASIAPENQQLEVEVIGFDETIIDNSEHQLDETMDYRAATICSSSSS